MKTLLRHKALLALVIAVVLLLTLSLISLITGGHSPVGNFLNVIFQPIRSAASGISDGISNMYSSMYDYDAVVAENAQLKIRLSELEKNEREFEREAAENERLKQLLGLSEERPDFQFQSASIVARDVSNWSKTFTLDKGTGAGIKKGDCVISAEHYLVGVITDAGHNWSTVLSVIDTETELGAIIYRTGITSIVEGDFRLSQEGLMKLSLLPLDADVKNGDYVLTSGTGGIYPKDIAIGVVERMDADASGLSANAIVRPFADAASLTQVFVIIGFDQ